MMLKLHELSMADSWSKAWHNPLMDCAKECQTKIYVNSTIHVRFEFRRHVTDVLDNHIEQIQGVWDDEIFHFSHSSRYNNR